MNAPYSAEEEAQLLEIARQTLESVTHGKARPVPEISALSPRLCEPCACFVTLYVGSELRGCTGTLTARRPLVDEVSLTTVQTAFNDPRFVAVRAEEVPHIRIEISVLTSPQPLHFDSPEALVNALRPGIDGVTLKYGTNRSTFLPQVWEKVPDSVQFLTMLSRKMGMPGDAWRRPGIEVETYQCVVIEEQHAPAERLSPN